MQLFSEKKELLKFFQFTAVKFLKHCQTFSLKHKRDIPHCWLNSLLTVISCFDKFKYDGC